MARLFATSTAQGIVEIDPADGTVLNTFAAPTTQGVNDGLAFDGLTLWYLSGSWAPDTLYKLDPNTGAVRASFTLPNTSRRDGLAVIGEMIYIANSSAIDQDILEVSSATGAVLRTIEVDTANPNLLFSGGLGALRNPDALLVPDAITSDIYLLSLTDGSSTDDFDGGLAGDLGLAAIGDEIFVAKNTGLTDQITVFNRQGVQQRMLTISGSIGLQSLAGHAGPPSYVASRTAGSEQAGRTGEQLAEPLTVWITGPGGSPAADKTVVFTVSAGTATLDPTSVATAADGSASTSVTLGETPGAVKVTAAVDGIVVATFALTIQPSEPGVRIDAGGVVSSGLSSPEVRAISPNAIMTVFGEGFAPEGTRKILMADDLDEGRVPLSLAGVCVEVGGARSPIFAVLPNQINFQAPELPDAGVVDVKVIAACGSENELPSNRETVAVQTAAPEFFYFVQSPDGRNPIAAVNAMTGAFIGAPGLISGVTFTPARPGDILTLFLTGVGRTTPHPAPGEIPAGAASATANIEVIIGGAILDPARVLYIGVTPGNAGLYQLNIRLQEDLPEGDLEIVIAVDGHTSPAQAYITVSGT